MRRLVRRLTRQGFDLRSARTLELFGGSGRFHTVDYARCVGSLEVWEIDERHAAELRKRLPHARIRIVDTYIEIGRTPDTFDLVVVDNPMSTWGGRCEHFDLFPSLFSLLASRAVVVLNVIPRLTDAARTRYPYLFNNEHLARRTTFYRTEHPEDVRVEEMVRSYERYALRAGFRLEWHLLVRRHFVYYLALSLARHEAGTQHAELAGGVTVERMTPESN